jgi:hypothetical protein
VKSEKWKVESEKAVTNKKFGDEVSRRAVMRKLQDR